LKLAVLLRQSFRRRRTTGQISSGMKHVSVSAGQAVRNLLILMPVPISIAAAQQGCVHACTRLPLSTEQYIALALQPLCCPKVQA
jgi:hypothetical protein